MKQNELGNVLIKILGLYFCVDGIVRFVAGLLSLLAYMTSRGIGALYTWVAPFTGMILAAIGLLLILLSRTVADTLFKDE